MSKGNFNPDEFKINQRQSWDSVASGWQKWWKTIEIGAQKVSNRLVELAEIRTGLRVLDIATGIGEPAITAGKIVGKKGHMLLLQIYPHKCWQLAKKEPDLWDCRILWNLYRVTLKTSNLGQTKVSMQFFVDGD